MEFGAVICKPSNPMCHICNLKKNCYFFKNKTPVLVSNKLQGKEKKYNVYCYLKKKKKEIALTKKTGSVVKKVDYGELPLEDRICRKIKDGFKQNGHAYDMSDMADLYRIGEPMFDTMSKEIQRYHSGLIWTIGSGGQYIGNKTVSFSGNYWVARNYSIRNPGCETIKFAVNVARWISELPSCPQQKIAEKILKAYGPVFDGHVPCVYAARLPPERGRSDGWEAIEKSMIVHGKPGKNANSDHSVENYIPKESIIPASVFELSINIFPTLRQWRKSKLEFTGR